MTRILQRLLVELVGLLQGSANFAKSMAAYIRLATHHHQPPYKGVPFRQQRKGKP
jgi:hypothetical protein